MALDTYSDLKTRIADWINKSNLTSYIPDFIRLAEADAFRRLRIRKMEALGTGTLSVGDALDLSTELTRFAKLKSVAITVSGEYRILNYLSPQQYLQYYAVQQNGIPQDYTQIGDKLHFGKTPSDAYAYSIWYYQKFEALSDSVSSNWLLANAPDVYLFGALKQTAPFLKNDQRLATWGALYEQALAGLEMESLEDRPGGTSKQMSEMGTP